MTHNDKKAVFSLDAITLGVPIVQDAKTFYTAVFAPSVTDHGHFIDIDMHDTGRVALRRINELADHAGMEAGTTGFHGYIMSYIVSQPSEVKALLDAAVRLGAKVLKPAKASIFGGFSAVWQAPDGAIWKISAPTKKDTAPARQPPRATETAALLGVTNAKASKDFYVALGMTVDRDYGSKYVDFRPAPATCRLGLMPRRTIAKDVGVDTSGNGFQAVVFNRNVHSTAEVDNILKTVATADGKIVALGRDTGYGYTGHFTDPDGYLWQVTAVNTKSEIPGR